MVAFFAITTAVLLALPSVLAEPISLPSHISVFARHYGGQGWDPAQIPPKCYDDCKKFVESIGCCLKDSCLNLHCVCSNTVVDSAKHCLQCVVDQKVPGFTQADADAAINDYKDTCKAIGFPVSNWNDGKH